MLNRKNAAANHVGLACNVNEAKVYCLIYSMGGADVGPEVGFLYHSKSLSVSGGGLMVGGFTQTEQYTFL